MDKIVRDTIYLFNYYNLIEGAFIDYDSAELTFSNFKGRHSGNIIPIVAQYLIESYGTILENLLSIFETWDNF